MIFLAFFLFVFALLIAFAFIALIAAGTAFVIIGVSIYALLATVVGGLTSKIK